MYDELINRLRYLAKVYSICDNENTNEYRLAIEAADAIEELQKRVPKTPHGRLIDADAWIAKVREELLSPHSKKGALEIMGAMFRDVLDAPTIIESEE